MAASISLKSSRGRELSTGADLVIAELHRYGVRTIFGMPGSHTTHLYDAIHRHGGIETVLCRNEQAGAFMADGYARVTGRPGVICTTAGPGATNALTGIAEAYSDSVPVLLLTGQVNHDRIHLECGNYHEIDLEAICRPCTAYARTIMRNDDIPSIVANAFHAMTAGRPRPAALICPQDLMAAFAGSTSDGLKNPSPVFPANLIDDAAALLRSSRRPIILAGGGAVSAGAASEIREVAARLNCPVITTLNGKGIIDERDPLSLGHGRSVRARAVLPHADAMLAIGCRFTEVFTWFRNMRVPDKLVQIDIDRGQIGMNYPATVGLIGDARHWLGELLGRLPVQASTWGETWTEAAQLKHPRPEWFIDTLREMLPEDAVVFTDACEMAVRMQTDYPAYAPRTFFYPSNYITLGWGFPAAVGAAVAQRDRVTVSVSGDGGFTMTSQELSTAARYNLKLIAIVHNDSTYGAIKNLQRNKHEARFHDTELVNPEFLTLAKAYGIPARRANGGAEFRTALAEAISRDGPSLIEVPDEWRQLRDK